MAGPIRPRRFERKAKPLRSEEAQAPRGQGRSGYVAAQAFESSPVRARDPPSRMQRKAARSEAQGRRTHPGDRIFQDPSQALTGAGPGGDEPSHRSHGESRQHGLLVGERIGCGVVEQPAFPAQADDAAHSSPRSAAPLGPTTAEPLRKPDLHPHRRRPRRPGAPPYRPCAGRCRKGRTPASCRKRQPPGSPRSPHNEPARTRRPESRIRGRPASLFRRGAAVGARTFGLAGERFPDARRGSGRGAPFPVRGDGTRVGGQVWPAWCRSNSNGRTTRARVRCIPGTCSMTRSVSAQECEDFHPRQVRPATAGHRIPTLTPAPARSSALSPGARALRDGNRWPSPVPGVSAVQRSRCAP